MSASMLRFASRRTVSIYNASIPKALNTTIRCIATSPVKPFTVTKSSLPDHKFSYEKACRQALVDNTLTNKSDTLDFGAYQRTFKLTISEEEASKIPSILALHARLNLSKNYQYSTLVRSLTCQTADSDYADNLQMSLFGAHLLSYYVTEHLIATYPRLPVSILRNATEAYIGDYSLYDVAKNVWDSVD
ncbi:unnamed protein product [Ambrosiozyma monospora]|uniref:Unnamed protein product n=1 Tax=Ambrosiozyma monospora TaxID=43982 RepID=A0ACB5T8N3_AMBMO|nr:unnamed protein product [Ambrosiozyma monospora]